MLQVKEISIKMEKNGEGKERSSRHTKEHSGGGETDDKNVETKIIDKIIEEEVEEKCTENEIDNNNNKSNDNDNNNDNDKNESTDKNVSTSTGGRVLYSFIRRRSQGGFHAYGLTTVKMLKTGQKVEVNKILYNF